MKSFNLIGLLLVTIYTSAQPPVDRSLGLQYADLSMLTNVPFVLPPKTTQGVLKPSISFKDDFPPINSQGNIGSCASWATAYGLRSFIEKKKQNYSYTTGGQLDETKVFSPLFIFNQVKLSDKRCDSVGSYIKDNLDKLIKIGVCKKNTFDPKPYEYPCCTEDPLLNPLVLKEAKSYKIKSYGYFIRYDQSYHSGYKLIKIKEFLNKGYPVIIGTDIDYTFWVQGGTRKGNNIIWSNHDGIPVGGHAMVCIGYNDTLKAIQVFNSWGTSWANDGYGWISYDLLDDYLFEGYIANIENLSATNTMDIVSNGTESSPDNPSPNLAHGIDNAFFIENRYRPYNNLRIMPLDIKKKENSGIVKIYERKNDKSRLIDVFTIKVGETYSFTHDDYNYEFKCESIKPYKFLGKQAIFYTIRWTLK